MDTSEDINNAETERSAVSYEAAENVEQQAKDIESTAIALNTR